MTKEPAKENAAEHEQQLHVTLLTRLARFWHERKGAQL